MGILKLHELINLNREEIIRRCATTATPHAAGDWMNHGVAAIVDQVMIELRDGQSCTDAIDEVVTQGGDALMSEMATVSHLSQACRSVGPSIIEIAAELNVPITAEDSLMLDRCLDAAIVHAITQHARRQNIASGRAVNKLRDLTDTAISAFEVLQTGTVGVIGKTGALVLRSLLDIRALTATT